MKRIFLLCIGFLALIAFTALVNAKDYSPVVKRYQPLSNDDYNIAHFNRVHREGNVEMNFTNWGIYGNGGFFSMEDPEYPGTQAPQCEFPANSDVQYLFLGGLWIGALIQEGAFEYPRVSCGFEGWTGPGNNSWELEPGEIGGTPVEEHGILERSNVPGDTNYLGQPIFSPSAVAPQEFIAVYTDTLTDSNWVGRDIVDGPHHPLGLKITQKSQVWNTPEYDDFIILDYKIKNIGNQFLKNIYLGLYMDADVGRVDENLRHEDDVTGFREISAFDTLNVAYIADNDGRPHDVQSGNSFTCPGVSGVMLLNAGHPVYTSYNWWVPNGYAPMDYGPSWQDDQSQGNWTAIYGTPNGDERKYFIMSNREFDFDQWFVADLDYISSHPQQWHNPFGGEVYTHYWKTPDPLYPYDLANGFDARYLLSWGPLGIFDHWDFNGDPIYRLNPGEEFSIVVAYVCGADFHDPSNPQGDLTGNNPLDPTLYDYAGLIWTCERAQEKYESILGIKDELIPNDRIPTSFRLHQNYPNPFNARTVFEFELPQRAEVKLYLYDIQGRKVATLAEGIFQPGRYKQTFSGEQLASGVYFVSLSTGNYEAIRKVVLLK